ncbi:annulin-like [Anopheles marshallii]|uniref:annulin-like n=1 Tax=Anopheles marshallii TaxID=1521116 RepID=UPI00237AC2A4|nr:annulin-like [Anopheles marshallii]
MAGTSAPHTLPFAFWQQQDHNDDENEIEDDMQSELIVERIDSCLKENGVNHRTERFASMSASANRTESSQLVIRRGQEFLLKLICNRPIDPKTDAISLVLAVDPIAGEWISHGHGTVVYMLLQTDDNLEEDHDSDWNAKLQSTSVNEENATELLIAVRTSPNASVSKWTLTINVKSKGSGKSTSYQLDQPFYLLFNPWCEEDPVYLDNEDQRQEYVLEDMTMIWKGNERSFHGHKWKLGQYETNILDWTFLLLGDVARVSATYRGNPIKVCRALSGVVNSNDDYGVLVGNWSKDYNGGTAPSAWTGSVKILQEYYETDKPVRYGQCWVFAGVLATLCRALGIPCRIVTNFASAHDTEASLTVDIYMDEEGNVKENFSRDSVWNFHVWNEVWLKRRDLGTNVYDGWQVIDGTPQEFSDGAYKLGPAPVEAVKNGLVNMLYDCDFVFAEVNADRVFWRYRGPSKPLKLIQKNTTDIGQFISTKAIGSDDREDITNNYKCGEQSSEARIMMLRALKLGQNCLTKHYLKQIKVEDRTLIKHEGRDVEFELELNDQAMIGESFSIALRIRNVSFDDTHKISGIIHLKRILYTGKNVNTITSHSFSKSVGPGSEEVIEVPIQFEDYYEPGMDEAIFKVTSFANIEGVDYEYFSQEDYSLRKPDVQLELSGRPVIQSTVKVTASFSNPLPIPINEGAFQIECSGLAKTLTIPVNSVAANERCEVVFMIRPSFKGNTQLSAKFQSPELTDIEGSFNFEVEDREENNELNDVLVFS